MEHVVPNRCPNRILWFFFCILSLISRIRKPSGFLLRSKSRFKIGIWGNEKEKRCLVRRRYEIVEEIPTRTLQIVETDWLWSSLWIFWRFPLASTSTTYVICSSCLFFLIFYLTNSNRVLRSDRKAEWDWFRSSWKVFFFWYFLTDLQVSSDPIISFMFACCILFWHWLAFEGGRNENQECRRRWKNRGPLLLKLSTDTNLTLI